MNIGFEEEKKRLHRTWQSWDRVLWEVLQKDRRIVAEHAIDVDRYQKQVDAGDLVLGFSDQVPWWGFVKTPKQMYLVWKHLGG